ncbi:MAG: hypothetical protein QOJ80_5460 [Mycobacterium sp.]|jgi:hypothetical protein|nr:hypothetical protein [Mycobacterium sp.]
MNSVTLEPPFAIESGADPSCLDPGDDRHVVPAPPHRNGGLDVRGVRLTIDGGQTLLDGVSFSARTAPQN